MKKIIKDIYKGIPFKKQLFSVIKIFNPSPNIYQHLYFKGMFKVKIENTSFNIVHHGYQLENDIFWTGLKKWEHVSLGIWVKLSKQAKVILDVGANTGIYSLIAGVVNRTASVYAFEPLTFRQLTVNLSINDLNIKPSNIAVSNKDGDASFFTDNENFSYSASLNKEHHSNENKIEVKVKTKTLDSFCEENNLIPDLVKIDVERHEPEVIEGFINTIKRYSPSILIEVLDESIGERLRELLQDTPYLYYSINDEKGTCKRMTQMGKSEDYNVLICTKETARSIGLMDSL